jgi:predicted transcriptional regulator
MRQEIDQSDINQMNNLIFKKIKEQFEKDLTPSEFIATSRLALAFQKTIQVNEVTERDEKEIYENIMSVLDRAGMRIAENESDDNDNL